MKLVLFTELNHKLEGEFLVNSSGGANVITLADLIDDLPNEFVALDRGQTIQTSYRQSVRIGKNHGKLLEDYGVFVDKVFAPTVEDILYKKEERSTLFDRIAVDLINAGKSTKRDNMTCIFV